MRNERTQYINKLRKIEGVPVKKGLFKLLDYIKIHNIPCAASNINTKRKCRKYITFCRCMGLS